MSWFWSSKSGNESRNSYFPRLAQEEQLGHLRPMRENERILLTAIEAGNCTEVLNLLENGTVDLEIRDQNGQTPLIAAAEKGSVDIVHELLKKNTHVNAQDEDGWTPLIAASKEGHFAVVRQLLENGAKVRLPDLGGWTPLVWASYKGHADIVRELLSYDADPNESGQHGMTSLIWASGRGHSEIVADLLNAGANVNAADKYGTTSLVWAARKGHLKVIKNLLSHGADVSIAGTRGWTALIMAAKGGYSQVVDVLLQQNQKLDAADQEGYTALAWSAKQGHEEIVQKLLARGAHYNLPNKEGETVLISAARDGHVEVIRTLLSKFADIEGVDSEGKTALLHATEKGYTRIVKELLDAGANTEVTNKDGETPLLRATQKKHAEIVSLLLDKGANVCYADKRGDTAVHVAVRGRYKRICELLLRNPKDARLLYRPNKFGETPYNIDRQHKNSILTQIFGTGLLSPRKTYSEDVMGYDVYTSALADVLCEPSLSLPLTVGMYARWGSGKSFMLRRLQDEMKEFAHQDMRPLFHFSRFIFVLVLLLSVVIGVVLWAAVNVTVGTAVGLSIFITCYVIFFAAYVSDRRYNSGGQSCNAGGYIAKSTASLKLLLQLMFCVPPSPGAIRAALPVRFLFTDFSKLTCGGSEAGSLVGMIETLCDLVENDLGVFITRLYRVFRVQSDYDESSPIEPRWKRCCCCIPTFILFLFIVSCGLIGGVLYKVYGTEGSSVVVGVQVAAACVVGIAVLVQLPTFLSILYSLIFSQKKRISVVATQLGLKEEGFIHALKQEVELLTDLVHCVDGFTRHQTRIVILVDGLDSSEQSKVLQLLDSVNLLFTDPDAPFVCLMALDPRVIIRAIDQSFSSILRESHISASDYLKSIIQLPFYLPEPKSNYTGVLPAGATALLNEVRRPGGSTAGQRVSEIVEDLEWDGEMFAMEPDAARVNRDAHSCNGGLAGRVHPDMELDQSMLYVSREGGERAALEHHRLLERELEMEERRRLSADLAQVLADNEAINPLGVKRLMNIVSLTCRLLRARGLEYSWKRLAAWVSLVDGWPYKTSWLVLLIEDTSTHITDKNTLKDIYEATLSAMPVINEVDCAVDGDPVYFETFLGSHEPLLNAGDVRKFLSCTVHLDASLRRQMVECLQTGTSTSTNKSDTESVDRHSCHEQAGMEKTNKEKSLTSFTIEDVCKQLSELEGLDPRRVSTYQSVVTSNNINGKVLLTCDVSELAQIMDMTFGDWQLFRAWVLTSRNPDWASLQVSNLCTRPGEMTCPPVYSASGAWDDGKSVSSSPRKSVSSCTEQVAEGSTPTTPTPVTPSAELKPRIPAIVLLPPSAPESEEEEEEPDEENCETTETELEKDDKDGGEEVIMAKCYAQPEERRSLDEELPPPPDIPPFCFDNESDLPSPPPVSMDLISFGEAEEEQKDYTIVSEINQRKAPDHIECSCETASLLQATSPDAMSRKSSKNSLLFDFPESELIGRPAPIVLTMDRGGPVKSAQVVKRSSSTAGPVPAGFTTNMQPPPTAPKPAPAPPPLVGAASRGPSGKRLDVENMICVRPRSATDMTFLSAENSVKPGAKPWSISAETGLDGCAKMVEQTHDDFSDFPPPPPPLEDELSSEQEESPWVPLMQRFQLVSDAGAHTRGDNVSSTHRKSKVKTPRTHTSVSKSSYIEIRSDELKGAKSETRV